MSQSQSQTSVEKVYQSVIDDVMNGVREAFLDEGIDEQVLQELKMLWESKLHATKALESSNNTTGHNEASSAKGNSSKGQHQQQAQSSQHHQSHYQSQSIASTTHHQQQQQHQQIQESQIPHHLPDAIVPIQITMPKASGPPGVQKPITIHVPAACIHQNKLQEILSLPAVQATLALPPDIAAANLQAQVNLALKGDILNKSAQHGIVQVDGQAAGGDTSDDDDDDEEDDDDLDDDDDGNNDDREEEPEDEGQDEEPLNSGDDVSDAEDSNDKLYEIDNVVVCQYDKITRTRNKWKFHLKDGIMNLNGKDYVFQKATGDAEW